MGHPVECGHPSAESPVLSSRWFHLITGTQPATVDWSSIRIPHWRRFPMKPKILLSALCFVLVPMIAGAADTAAPAKDAFRMKNDQMMTAMHGVSLTGDADKDFVNMMIPHHQGAVDMAKIELQYGKDPQLKQIAQWIVDSQGQEIGMFKTWQAAHQ
jgi:hypothetical protein